MSFPIRFVAAGAGAPLPRIEITFLRSYEGFVDAELSINASGCAAQSIAPAVRSGRLLNGTWERQVSTPFTLTLGSLDVLGRDGVGHEQLALSAACVESLQLDVPYALTITLRSPSRRLGRHDGGKFKILGVSACITLSVWENA